MENVWKPESRLLEDLDRAVPEILAGQRADGRFGSEPWISTDQNVLLPLAAAWTLPESAHYHSSAVLAAIVQGGDALLTAQDETGKFTFRKKDNSEWGQIYMPWVYSRWIRAYQLVRQALSAAELVRWDQGLELGFEGIAAGELERIHNIPAHHAMALFCAGQVFGRQEWKDKAEGFIGQVVQAQSEHGWWSEHAGPVVAYNYVYTEALGVYFALAGDPFVLVALERAAEYHTNYLYPDGSLVETIDERNSYHRQIRLGNPGFSHTAVGRAFLQRQHRRFIAAGHSFDPDYAAALLLYGSQGPAQPAAEGVDYRYKMGSEALIERRGPWFLSLSAYCAPLSPNRFVQDRQNLISVYHDRVGLVIGGGNTKLQPRWSTFTLGDPALLPQSPGEEEPDFFPRGDFWHVPNRGAVREKEGVVGLDLGYGERSCRVVLKVVDEDGLQLCFQVDGGSHEARGHLTLLPHLDQPLHLDSGQYTLGTEALELPASKIEHAGWRLELPVGSQVLWPVLPHNPYRKDGEADLEEGRLVAVLPLGNEASSRLVRLEVV